MPSEPGAMVLVFHTFVLNHAQADGTGLAYLLGASQNSFQCTSVHALCADTELSCPPCISDHRG